MTPTLDLGPDTDGPRYVDLPQRGGVRSAWGMWGAADVLGTLNRITPARVAAAAAEIRDGETIALSLPMELPDPPLYRRAPLRHEIHHDPGRTSQDDLLLAWNPQSSSQWDGFRHVRRAGHGFFGGIADGDHGVGHWGARGIAGRAVLADVARWRASIGRPLEHDAPDPIDPEDVVETLRAQGSTVMPGDVLLIRTGFLTWYRTLDAVTRWAISDPDRLRSPGLRPVEASAELLWDLGLAAVAADNPALEVWPVGALLDPAEVAAIRADPEREPEMQLHTRVLTMLGMPIGELWDLDGLADRGAADGRYGCFLVSAPLRLHGGVGSPANAIAIR